MAADKRPIKGVFFDAQTIVVAMADKVMLISP
jgi:hypothetical protein